MPADVSGASNGVSNSSQLKFIQSLQTIFAKQHFQQLRLDYATNDCYPNSKVFLEDVDLCEIDNRVKKEASALLKERRIEMFLHLMNKRVSSNQFIGSDLAQSVLEVILTINHKNDEELDSINRRLQSASLLFEKIIDNFPPTWPASCKLYKSLLHKPISIEIDFKKIRMNSSDGFLEIILALLNDALTSYNSTDNNEQNSSGFDSMMNFQQFERLESEKCCYLKLTRNQRIDRLFIVLNLLVKLMEIDLSLWIQRYPLQTKNFMSNPNTCPLIGHFLWKGKEAVGVNSVMRDVFKRFTMSVWIDFPNDKTDILARLVSLMAVAVSLCENCDNEKLISYPNIKTMTTAFAMDLIKNIESYPYTVKFYINIISKIRSPAIRMIVCVRILNKFCNVENDVNLCKIVDEIAKRSYNRYMESSEEVTSGGRTNGNYPTYDPNTQKPSSKHLKINRDEYLTLILHLLKSYNEVYRTIDLQELFLSEEMAAPPRSNEQYKELHQKAESDRMHQIDYDRINFKQLRTEAKRTASTDLIPVAPCIECRKVYLDASQFERYENDLRQLLKLKKLVDRTAVVEQEGSFKTFCEAVREYLSI